MGLGPLQVAYQERSEFLVEMRRNAHFEARGLAVIPALDDMPNFMEPSDDFSTVVRDGEFQELTDGP